VSVARLLDVALALLARQARALPDGPERSWLEKLPVRKPQHALWEALDDPCPADVPLLALRQHLPLTDAELVTVALASEVEADLLLGRALARLQHPIGASRPTLGWLAGALVEVFPDVTVPALAAGAAVGSGLLELTASGVPLPERAVAVPLHLLAALRGERGACEGCAFPDADAPIALPASVLEQAQRHAEALASAPRRALVLRCGHEGEACAAASAVAAALGRTPLFIEAAHVPGLAPWLLLAGLVPVFVRRPAPGERAQLPRLPGYTGPLLAVAGPDGAVDAPHGAALAWRLSAPAREERRALWSQHLEDAALAAALAATHRHGSGRIAELGSLARHHASTAGRSEPSAEDVRAVAWLGEGSLLSALAQPIPADVPEDVLVTGPAIRAALDLLLERCRAREALGSGLGPAARQRYTPGVRALLVGPSGTGKTLAALWLAARLGMPLYRVDVASVTSKYIGETERNLADLLARAEHAEVVLLFDEADSLFGKRTDVRHSTDRFANAQTNYLLQRIETYEGIVLLTSNSRTRFDEAFMRRLDVVLEMPAPAPEQRRDLWRAHLGEAHEVDARDLNRLAALVDLSGGHVRNVVLCAAVLAGSAARPIRFEDLLRGLELEYRKLGRNAPAGLGARGER
jgi:hypothetical protein